MPRQVIPTSSNGATMQWDLFGADTEWEAVLRDSSDSSFVQSATFGALAQFNCGAGYQPIGGRIMAVTLHYRMRAVNPGSGAVVDLQLWRGGGFTTAGVVPLPTDTWVEGEIRLREDWLTSQRFTVAGVPDLGAAVEISTAPTTGAVQVSQLWLAVEYVEGPWIYDPYDGNLPNAILGPLNWSVGGTETAALVNNYLRITDTSPTATRNYFQIIPGVLDLGTEYITEVETRVTVTNVGGGPNTVVYAAAAWTEDSAACTVAFSVFGGMQYIGIIGASADALNINDYLAIEPFNYEDQDLHLRLKLDRDNDGPPGRVELYVNYSDTPLLSGSYYDLGSASPPFAVTLFGTAIPGTSIVDVDYYAYKTYKKRGSLFRSWNDWVFSTNEVTADVTDAEIVKKVEITPPGIMAGQSNYACLLDVQDSDAFCETTQTYMLPATAPQTYKLDLDYKQDSAVISVQVVIQRFPDLYYWDDVGKVWDPNPQAVTAPFSASRTMAALVTGLSVPSADNILLITLKTDVSGPPTTHKAWIYKVYLVEE